MTRGQDQFSLQIQGIEDAMLRVLRFTIQDFGIAKHYVGQVEVLSLYKLMFDDLAQHNVCLEIAVDSYIHGVVTGLVPIVNHENNSFCYKLIIESPLHFLKIKKSSRVFVDKDLEAFVGKIFCEAGFNTGYKIIGSKIPRISWQMQLDESDLVFFTRVLSQIGWFYFFIQTKQETNLIITDDINQLPGFSPRALLSVDNFIPTYRYQIVDEEHPAWQQEVYEGKTGARELQLNSFEVDIFYRVLSIAMQGDQTAESITYCAKFTAIKASAEYVAPALPVPRFFQVMPALIWGNGEEGCCIDEKGCYRVKFLFDLNDDSAALHSIPLEMVNPYNAFDNQQGASGIRFPLKKNTLVAVGFMEGDLRCPFILGVISDANHPSPVTHENHMQSVIRTEAGNELVLEDRASQQYALLGNRWRENYLLLDNLYGDHKIILAAAVSQIGIYAGKDIELKSEANIIYLLDQGKSIMVRNDQKLKTNTGHILLTAGHNYFHKTKIFEAKTTSNDINYQAQTSIKTAADNEAKFTAQADIKCSMRGDIILYAKDSVLIQGSGRGKMTIGNDKARIIIAEDGSIEIAGKKLIIAVSKHNKHSMANMIVAS